MKKKGEQMRMVNTAEKYRGRWFVLATLLICCFCGIPAEAGPYLDSAHGNSEFGVNRSDIDGQYADFATGNCAHCHETHASLQGAEPSPVSGPQAHALFTSSFDSTRTQNPYLETDNFCFSCHSEASGQQVINQNYSTAFGGATAGTGPQSINEAFNQASYHNLYDIWSFLQNNPFYPGYSAASNPCSACHNSHLAKRNWDNGQAGFPLLSSISKPNASNSLWGELEVMSTYSSYEAPFAFTDSREPAGVGDPDGVNTPDYVGFCISCHNPDNNIWSTVLNRELKEINWGETGLGQDKHGALTRDGADYFREPYLTAGVIKTNFVLSCLDCHEPHGSANIMLLRSRINGEALEGSVVSTDVMSYACKRCHTDDLAAGAGTGEADRWAYVYHGAADAPYEEAGCAGCHGGGGPTDPNPIACGNCHGHGMDDSWLPTGQQSGRQTF